MMSMFNPQLMDPSMFMGMPMNPQGNLFYFLY